MSEQIKSPEVEPTVEIIGDGLRYWLAKEIGNSVVGRNKVLDDFSDWRHSLSLPYDDPSNVNSRKNKSHHSQLIDWTKGLVEYYDTFRPEQAEYVLARQMFRAQMYLSGLFRVHCFMAAADQEDYYHRRLELENVGIDIDVESTVAERLGELFGAIPDPDEFTPTLTLGELTERTLALNDEQRAYVEELHVSGRNDVGQESSPTIDTILGLENKWVGHVVDYIAFIASERGGQLEAVPFLEAKSISDDPQPYYPFAT